MRTALLLAAALLVTITIAACSDSGSPATGSVELIDSLPHEGNAWAEGLLVSEGILWESTGLKGKSEVRGLDMTTGDVLWAVPNPQGFFGEGLVRTFGKTYLLSYQEGQAYLFDRDAAQPYEPFATYEGEGWGLTATDEYLINSNGSANLYYRDPETFEIVREVTIQYAGKPVTQLNELEYDGTYVWTNQWQTRYVYRIKESDPSQVTRFELPPDVCPAGTPNGIAWDEEEKVFYLTGQRCPDIWKVRFR